MSFKAGVALSKTELSWQKAVLAINFLKICEWQLFLALKFFGSLFSLEAFWHCVVSQNFLILVISQWDQVIRYRTPSKAFCQCGHLTALEIILVTSKFREAAQECSFLQLPRMVEKPDDAVGKVESTGDLLKASRWSWTVAWPMGTFSNSESIGDFVLLAFQFLRLGGKPGWAFDANRWKPVMFLRCKKPIKIRCRVDGGNFSLKILTWFCVQGRQQIKNIMGPYCICQGKAKKPQQWRSDTITFSRQKCQS